MKQFSKDSKWYVSDIPGMFETPLGSEVRFFGTIEELVKEANYAFAEGYFAGVRDGKKGKDLAGNRK